MPDAKNDDCYATEKRLIATRYMIQISAHLSFSYTKRDMKCSVHKALVAILHASQSECTLHLFFGQQKYNNGSGTLFVMGGSQWQRRRI